jgi:hypothetical protein
MPAVPILFMEVATEIPPSESVRRIPRAGHYLEDYGGIVPSAAAGLSARELATAVYGTQLYLQKAGPRFARLGAPSFSCSFETMLS